MAKREPIDENAGPAKRKTEGVAFFMRPTPGRIIVREDEFNYRGLIHVPDSAKRRPTTGKIVAVGEGVTNWDLQVGKKVVYGMYSGTVISFKEQPAFRVLGQDEILAVIDDVNLVLEGVGT